MGDTPIAASWFRIHVVDSFADAASCSWTNARLTAVFGLVALSVVVSFSIGMALLGVPDRVGGRAVTLLGAGLALIWAPRMRRHTPARPKHGWLQPGALLFMTMLAFATMIAIALAYSASGVLDA